MTIDYNTICIQCNRRYDCRDQPLNGYISIARCDSCIAKNPHFRVRDKDYSDMMRRRSEVVQSTPSK